MVSNGTPLQLFVSGQDGTQFGDYALVRGSEAVAHSCDTDTYVMPGVSFSQPLTQDNSCHVTIQFSPFPPAVGKPLLAHYYGVMLEAGRSYTIAIGGVSTSFDAGLTIFAGGVAGQDVPNDSPNTGTRSSSFFITNFGASGSAVTITGISIIET